MPLKYAMAVILFACLFLVGVYDAYVLSRGWDDATVSSVVRIWSKDFPIVPFACGFLACHLFT